jgi:hypothetical protein
MFVTLLRQVMIAGEPANAGSVLDLPETVGTLLIGIGKATATEPPKVAEPAAEPPTELPPAKAPKPRSTKTSPLTLED